MTDRFTINYGPKGIKPNLGRRFTEQDELEIACIALQFKKKFAPTQFSEKDEKKLAHTKNVLYTYLIKQISEGKMPERGPCYLRD